MVGVVLSPADVGVDGRREDVEDMAGTRGVRNRGNSW